MPAYGQPSLAKVEGRRFNFVHNGLGFRAPRQKPRVLMVRERFNTGPTPRHAILDFIHLLDEHPEVWARISD